MSGVRSTELPEVPAVDSLIGNSADGTVTINIARSTPLVGEAVANVLRGGADLGALTLGRWYSAHVFLLPALLVTLIVTHIALMRKHGISGPIEPQKSRTIEALQRAWRWYAC